MKQEVSASGFNLEMVKYLTPASYAGYTCCKTLKVGLKKTFNTSFSKGQSRSVLLCHIHVNNNEISDHEKHDIFSRENNLHMKISQLLWLHSKSVFRSESEIIWCFIGVYIIKEHCTVAWKYEISLLLLKNIYLVLALTRWRPNIDHYAFGASVIVLVYMITRFCCLPMFTACKAFWSKLGLKILGHVISAMNRMVKGKPAVWLAIEERVSLARNCTSVWSDIADVSREQNL